MFQFLEWQRDAIGTAKIEIRKLKAEKFVEVLWMDKLKGFGGFVWIRRIFVLEKVWCVMVECELTDLEELKVFTGYGIAIS